MKRNVIAGVGLAVLGAAAVGYWSGRQAGAPPHTTAATGEASHVSSAGAQQKRRILYYRHPMGLPDTSPVPKKEAMGMDYVPVYEDEAPDVSTVKITPDKVQKLGVTSELVERRTVARTVRAVGTVQVDERRLHVINLKFEGWVERLLVNTTGERVRQGQPLMEVYSPDLITAQQEYAIAWKGLQSVENAAPDIRANMLSLAEASLKRLRNWDISEQEIRRLQTGEPVGRTLLLRVPITGIVLEKTATEGMRFMPGETLYRLADLSSLWVMAEVFEQDLGLIRLGQPARIALTAYPDRVFEGAVTFVYPTVAAETRTVRVRVELPNRDGQLKPDMFGTVEFAAAAQQDELLAVANSAVLDSGTRRVVLVEREAGTYEPREVLLGRRGDDYTEVLQGLAPGERVVTSANFLIDAESNLKSALGGFGSHAHGGAPATSTGQDPGAGSRERASAKGSADEAVREEAGQHSGRH